ncbi:hypothetical protein KIPB_002734, partial [Kipferlia bialata]
SPFRPADIKRLVTQLLVSEVALWGAHRFHRDLKPANILYSNDGKIRVTDFGLSCKISPAPLFHTPQMVTLWYRAPEVCLSSSAYTEYVDMFSIGLVILHLLKGSPILRPQRESAMIDMCVGLIGAPSHRECRELDSLCGVSSRSALLLPTSSAPESIEKRAMRLRQRVPTLANKEYAGLDQLIVQCLTWVPYERPTPSEALEHPWFQQAPAPTPEALMPSFPASHIRRQRKKSRNN